MDEPCRCFEDIEKALERIGRVKDQLVYDFTKNLLWFDTNLVQPHHVYQYTICDLRAGLLRVADKVDPPKPKDRKWRVGDELEGRLSTHWIITMIALSGEVAVQRIGHDESDAIRIRNDWRNMTIKSEMEAEK